MKVILLKDVRNVGMHGTVQNVADGYALNALFPQKLAVPATAEKIKEIEAQTAAKEAAKQKEAEQLNNKINSLRGKTVTIQSRATEKGGLFKAVTAADIAKAIRAQYSLEIPEAAIYIPAAIKTAQEHKVLLSGKGTEVKAELLVAVTPLQ